MKLRDRICLLLGGLALLASVLLVGGAPRWAQAIVTGLVALALATQVLARRRLDRVSPLVVLLGVAAVLTAIQLVPLPSGVLHALSPVGTTLREDGALLAHTSPASTISLDAAGSWRALAFFLTLLGVALLAARFAVSERGRFALLGAVAIACGVGAIVAGAHMLVNADRLYGLYEPLAIKPVYSVAPVSVIGPLLNPNHLGGLMMIGAVLSVGLAFYAKQPTQLRVVWIVTALVCTVVMGLTMSRGAAVGLVIGVSVVGGVLFASRSSAPSLGGPPRRIRASYLPVALVVFAGLAVALYASAGSVIDQLDNTSITELDQPSSKYQAWKSSLELVRESPWVGVGRGAIETALTRVNPGSAQFTYAQLENEYLSAVVEWGVPGALTLYVVFGWCLITALRRWRHGPLAAAAIGALAGIGFQSSVDFGVELLGLAIPVTIIAATLTLVPLRKPPTRRLVVPLRLGLIAALVLGGLVVLSPSARSVPEDHADIIGDPLPTMATIREDLQRHPLDYVGFGQAALVLSHANDLEAVAFLNHAFALHPTHPGLHRLAARMLVASGHLDQAAVEYALAMSVEAQPRRLLEEIVAALPDAAHAAAAIPTDYPNRQALLHSLEDLNRQDISILWLERIANRPQHDLRVIDELFELAMLRKDYDTAKRTAELRRSVAHTTTSQLMLAKVLFKRKELDRLLVELADVTTWSGRVDEKAQGWSILCDVQIEKHAWDTATRCLHRLDASGLPNDRQEILKRLTEVDQQRTFEAKMEAAQRMEAELKKLPPPRR